MSGSPAGPCPSFLGWDCRARKLPREIALTESYVCVVAYDREQRPDGVLAEVVHRLKAAYVRVGGLLQGGDAGSAACCANLFLEDIGTGRRVQVLENRGAGTRGCRLDPSGLAEAAGWVREAIEARPGVLFINRFGRQEAEGRGLLDEIGAAVMAGIPVVVAMNKALLPEWLAFSGDRSAPLAADPELLVAWCLERLSVPCG